MEVVIGKLGFDARWIRLVMICVKSVTYLVFLNGKLGATIVPTRGLRQGDPLSPYLFLLVGEVLSKRISLAIDEGSLRGITLSRVGPVISHLLFADESLYFM